MMMKGLKITLIVTGIVIGLILLDTIQARILKNSPLISWKERLTDQDSWVKRGILMDTYYCTKENDIVTISWHFKTSKFNCPVDNVAYGVESNNDYHSFFGKVVESHKTYFIVEPDENEEERRSSDKFYIDLGNDNDKTYEVGTDVKITYIGGINESYPAQIGTTKIELESVLKNDILEKINFIAKNGPVTSSNPYDYINANQNIYDELLNNPKDTFRYAISDLIQASENNRNGLTNYIEAVLCSKININFKCDFESASDYLEKYKEFLLKNDYDYNEYDIYAKSLLK